MTAAAIAPVRIADFGPNNLFTGAEIIHAHTRADMIADGDLVDMQQGDMQEVLRQHIGTMPCAMTRGLWEIVEKAVTNPRQCNDIKGVVHDILWMSGARRVALKVLGEIDAGTRALASLPLHFRFRVIITGAARQRNWDLVMSLTFDDEGHPALLFGFPGEQ